MSKALSKEREHERVNVKVNELKPGDIVSLPIGGELATFVAQTTHPVYEGLQLVIWRMGTRFGEQGRWSHDALDHRQVVGTAWSNSEEERRVSLVWALKGN